MTYKLPVYNLFDLIHNYNIAYYATVFLNYRGIGMYSLTLMIKLLIITAYQKTNPLKKLTFLCIALILSIYTHLVFITIRNLFQSHVLISISRACSVIILLKSSLFSSKARTSKSIILCLSFNTLLHSCRYFFFH